MSDFKFGAKLKLFGENDITIKPNPEFPGRVEYHDPTGVAVTRAKLAEKLKITDPNILQMIPEDTRVTDFVFDKNTNELELGVVIVPGDDFVLNKYKDIITIDEVSLYYHYDPVAKKGVEDRIEVSGGEDDNPDDVNPGEGD